MSQSFSINDYQSFYTEVINYRRYILTNETKLFLNRYRCEIKKNFITLSKGNIYYRAQNGFLNERSRKHPYQKERMFPLPKKASEGRINPKGIPYLYLTEELENSVYEIRAKYRSYITIAEFCLKRNIDVVYFHKRMEYFHYALLSEKEKNPDLSVWNEINKAFSMPVDQSDFTADYVPTQILAEIVKDEGFDGILYMSQYMDCYNLCLFNVNDAEFLNSSLTYIRSKYYE